MGLYVCNVFHESPGQVSGSLMVVCMAMGLYLMVGTCLHVERIMQMLPQNAPFEVSILLQV